MYEVKAIETEYNGYLFRSRTEARWAVFFDYIGEPYEYEKECFQLPSGKYLPDFFLPKKNLWVEIKGKEPTEKEWRKCVKLNEATGIPIVCLSGTPGKERGKMVVSFPELNVVACWVDLFTTIAGGELAFNAGHYWGVEVGSREGATFQESKERYLVFIHPGKFYFGHVSSASMGDIELYREAVAYSRQARFEKGVKVPRGWDEWNS